MLVNEHNCNDPGVVQTLDWMGGWNAGLLQLLSPYSVDSTPYEDPTEREFYSSYGGFSFEVGDLGRLETPYPQEKRDTYEKLLSLSVVRDLYGRPLRILVDPITDATKDLVAQMRDTFRLETEASQQGYKDFAARWGFTHYEAYKNLFK